MKKKRKNCSVHLYIILLLRLRTRTWSENQYIIEISVSDKGIDTYHIPEAGAVCDYRVFTKVVLLYLLIYLYFYLYTL